MTRCRRALVTAVLLTLVSGIGVSRTYAQPSGPLMVPPPCVLPGRAKKVSPVHCGSERRADSPSSFSVNQARPGIASRRFISGAKREAHGA